MPLRKNLRDFTMGADPEFIAVKGGKGSNACYGCDFCKNDSDLDSLGADGCGTLIEIRPDPSNDPIELVTTMRQILMGQMVDKNELRHFQWFAGSHYVEEDENVHGDEPGRYPMGGHIHFGINRRLIGGRFSTKLLSQYVGLSSCLIEDKNQGYLRRNGGPHWGNYGGFNDFRTQPYGFEYRTPSSWLTSPYVAAAILCLGKVVMYEVINNSSFEPSEFITHEDVRKMNTRKMRAKFQGMWQEVSQMALYPFYQHYLSLIPFLVKHRLTWFPKCSMKEAWGVHVSETPHRPVTLDSIWANYNRQTSHD